MRELFGAPDEKSESSEFFVGWMAVTISFAQVDPFLRDLRWTFFGRSFEKSNGWIDWKQARQSSTLLVGGDGSQASFIAGESTSKRADRFFGYVLFLDGLV
jgi:hypothetical protein